MGNPFSSWVSCYHLLVVQHSVRLVHSMQFLHMLGSSIELTGVAKWDVGPHHGTVLAEVDGREIEIFIYDAPGQEGHAMIDKYAYSADCILLCFALDFLISLENVIDKASNITEWL